MKRIEVEDIPARQIDEVMRRLRWDDYTDAAMRERIARDLLVGGLFYVTKKIRDELYPDRYNDGD